eukprot:TRINITY_DN12575_c0_g1_i2.p2 TRINITY_DN12575_c0_g1~~TRINITY_DN12575_c0_g1_i2.p2  ORF type:complete len:147 (+),score=18.75 TRINITY_DN12575_c0_g1_i2:284-724(+)
MGATYHWYQYQSRSRRFLALNGAPSPVPAWRFLAHRLEQELGGGDQGLFEVLAIKPDQLPAVWTVDFILGDDNQYYVGEFNCTCPGVFYGRPQCFTDAFADSVVSAIDEAALSRYQAGHTPKHRDGLSVVQDFVPRDFGLKRSTTA